MNEIHLLKAITLVCASVGSLPSSGNPTSPVGTSGSGTISRPSGDRISNAEEAASGLSESGRSTIIRETGKGISLGLADDGSEAANRRPARDLRSYFRPRFSYYSGPGFSVVSSDQSINYDSESGTLFNYDE